MVFKEPHLNAASEAIVSRLGGFDSYVGLHLRVGASMDKFAVGPFTQDSLVYHSTNFAFLR